MKFYEFIGEHAYTRDNFLVHKLMVTNLDAEATPTNVAEYFQEYGKIKKVQMLLNRGGRKCVIHFDDPKDAAKVLQKKMLFFMNRPIYIQVSDSSFQPEGQEFMRLLHQTKNKLNCNNVNTTNQKALILNLNDDCLEHICKYLPIDDQINFALTCQRFYHILLMLSKTQYVTFAAYGTVFRQRTPFENRIFLQIVGSQIKNLEISHTFKSNFILIGSFCTNVEKLKLMSPPNTNSLCKLILKMNLLQDLEISNTELNANFIKNLVKLEHLKNLNVKDCGGVSGENIHLLCGLEKISLNGSDLVLCHFKEFCKNLKKLHYLEIAYNCGFLKSKDCERLSKHLLELQTLKLGFYYRDDINLNWVANLPKLKNLEINDKEFLKNLNVKAEQLEELRIKPVFEQRFENVSLVARFKKLKLLHIRCFDITGEILLLTQLTELKKIRLEKCYGVTDDAVLKILENCLKLEYLILGLGDNNLSSTLPLKALKLLQEQRAHYRRTNCVTVVFNMKYGEAYIEYRCMMQNKMRDYQHVINLIAFAYNQDYEYVNNFDEFFEKLLK